MLYQSVCRAPAAAAPVHRPKVYSYARWSTDEQSKGDTMRRQVHAAERWAKANSLELDATLSIRDEGVSAFRGRNAQAGALGAFLAACERGLIEQGSYLLVESLDRLSRLPPRKAARVLDAIVDAGVTVVTLNDNQMYDARRLDEDHTAFIITMMVASRAHEESKTKGRRVAAAWSARRANMRAGHVERLTLRGPTWLVPCGTGWAIDDAKATTVRRIYAMTLAGVGEHKIAADLNAEGVPVMGRGQHWRRSTVAKLLRSRAVIGELVPGWIEHVDGRKRRVLEQPIPNAFPRVISDADWLAVRALKDGKAGALRGRHAGAEVAHVLAGLTRCPLCASAMTRINKGAGGRNGVPKLVCSRAKNKAGCRYASVPVAAVEDALMSDWAALVADIPAGDGAARLDEEYRALDAAIGGTEDHLSDLADALERSPSAEAARRVAKVEAELRSMRVQLEELDERRRMADQGLINARMAELAGIFEANEVGAEINRTAVNAALKVLFSGVVVDYPNGRLRFQWRQGGEAQVMYAWVDG